MSKQKRPNITPSTTSEFGILSNSRINNVSKYDTQFIIPNSNGICLKNKFEKSLTSLKKITSAQLLALFTTPIEIIPAPGAGYANLIHRLVIRHAGGVAYAGIASGEDLVLKYTNASGAEVSLAIETTGFLDQTTAQIRMSGGVNTSLTPVANAPVVLHLLSGNITTGNFDLQVFVEYDIIATDFTA